MSGHQFVPDPAVSIVRGAPLSEEPGLGSLTLSGFLREVTGRFAEREALVHRRPDGTVERWSYSQLWDRSVEVAKALVAGGLGKGERVGVLMTNRAEFLASVFGTALAGGVASPLSTFSTPHELEHLVASSACSVLLLERQVLKKDFAQILCDLDPAIAGTAPGGLASARFPFLQHLAMIDAEAPLGAIETWADFLRRGAEVSSTQLEARAATVAPADPGVLFFSSGSTNKPKGILSAHRGVSIQLWRMRRQQGLGEGVRTWTANGFFWSGNFSMVVGGTLAAGGSLVLQRTFQPEEALALMAAERVSFLFAWPHQWAQLEDARNWAEVDLSALKYVDADGPIARRPEVSTTWIEPRHAYGNTETFTLSTGYPANTSRAEAGDSHGPPLPGNTLKIVDPLTGVVTPRGARGEVAIKGPTLMLGYLGTPLDETLDDEGYFRTGDGGYVDEQGRLFWEGRLNDIIKTGGANVSPVEIDSVIQEHAGVKVSQTVGVPHETLGELVVTCIVPQDGAALDEAAVRDFAKEKLASYKVPRRVLFFAEGDLQLTGSAKVKTSDLRALAAKRLEAEAAS
ncbi:AMP-binding protein [Phenylobacterium sp. LjRoot219]|uniref:class I adenylate-forming enzyme family protein n=1 Tax=Phenylobacterium sp. LjRoot219 TaxID=3342283 RepID=UPI003ED01810